MASLGHNELISLKVKEGYNLDRFIVITAGIGGRDSAEHGQKLIRPESVMMIATSKFQVNPARGFTENV